MEHILLPQGLNFSLWQLISKDDLQCTKLPSIHRFVGSSPALTMARQVNSWTFAFRSLKLIQPLAQSNYNLVTIYLSSVQFSHSVVSDSLWPPWTAAHQASLSTTNSRSLLKLTSIESVMPSNHLTLCHPLLLPPSIFPGIGVFSNE